ncbi:LuxR C-terminal-related transcriptional regulator [Streptomyces sp. NPDC018031]|uniref:helix-turn-helix transcriptional regulator n=1 Tax=Streptomyces sp. NPDC018031 TaxID=3365033 RepID=UPI0037AF42F9
MLDLAVAALHEQDPGQLWPPIATELLSACGGEFLVLSEQWTDHEHTAHLWLSGGLTKSHIADHTQRLIRHSRALADHYVSSRDRTPTTTCRILGEVEWRNSSDASRMRESLAADQVLGLPLPDISGRVRGFLVYRTGSPFTDGQLAYARRIQPLLAGVDKQVALLRNWHASLPQGPGAPAGGAPAAPGGETLTPRESAVLALLADALTATAIGRRLGISARTVQKHIESIYRKLGTKDRVATVLRAQAYGLVPAGV